MILQPLNDTVFGEALEKAPRSSLLDLPVQQVENSFRVVAVGPDCRELQVGDVGLVESLSGTMVSIYDPDNDTLHRYYLIREANVLAVYREE